MSIYDTLNPKQKEAVLHTDGPLLILAGAGSGKITTATHPSSEYWASWNTTVVSVPGR